MRNIANVVAAAGLLAVLGVAPFSVAPAAAAGTLPSPDVCKANPTDAATQGGCIVLDRKKGNCTACHQIAGANAYGNIAPPLVSMQQRFPDRAKLRAQISDARVANPKTVMPPFGKFGILSEEEIDKVVDFLMTL
jgi:sulfur-oxidizing protein SoxX